MSTKNGFSSVEVFISILVIGIISAGVVIRLNSFSEYNKLEKAVWNVMKDITSSRSVAMKNDCTVRITFTDSSYTIHQDENGDGIPQSNEKQQLQILPEKISFKLSESSPSVAPSGATLPVQGEFVGGLWSDALVVESRNAVAMNSGSLYLSSSHNKKINFCITVSASQQQVHIYKWNGSSWIDLQ